MADHRAQPTVRKRLLITCENVQEVACLVPVAHDIEALSGGQISCEFTSQDAFYQQGVDAALQQAGVNIRELPYPIWLEDRFAAQSLVRKLRTLLATNRHLAPVMQEYDGLLCGIDSAPARMLIASAQKLGKPSFQVLISLYLGSQWLKRPWMERTWTNVKRLLLKLAIAKLAGADFLGFPALRARCGCNRVFVMGQHFRDVLIRDGVPEETVVAYGVPRFASLFVPNDAGADRHTPSQQLDILYITGAYKQVGMAAQHQLQQRQLKEIVEQLSQDGFGRYRLVAKVHPREQEEDYDWLHEYAHLAQVVPASEDLYECIRSSFVTVTIASTVGYEAVLLGRPVIIATFPDPSLLGLSMFTEDFAVADSAQALMARVCELSDSEDACARLVESELRNVAAVIDPRTPESSRLIAWDICNEMEVIPAHAGSPENLESRGKG